MDAQHFIAEFGHVANALGGISRLRQMIYQLAVTGRLTPGGRDSDVGELLIAIKALRQQLTRDKGRKRTLQLQSESVRPPEDVALPLGWRWSRLVDVGEINPRNDVGDDEVAAFVPMSGVPQQHGDAILAETKRWGAIKDGFTHFANGDVVLAKITPCFENGKAAVVRELPGDLGVGAGTTELLVFRPFHAGILPGYVYLFLRSPLFVVEAERNMTGTAGQKRLPSGYFATRAFPLPPTEEQARIVAKVDELMSLCARLEVQQKVRRKLRDDLRHSSLQAVGAASHPDELRSSWTRLEGSFSRLFSVPADVEGLRGLVLDLAMRGLLVSQDPAEGPASILYDQIEKAKRELGKAKKGKRHTSLPDVRADERPFALPSGWAWVRLGSVAQLINGDRGKNYPNKEEYVSSGVPWINTGHIERDGTLARVGMNFISREKFESLNSGKIESGDIVYCLRGATFGKTAFVTPYDEGAVASSLMIVRAILPSLRRFLYYYLVSPLGRSQIFRFDNGTAQPNLSANSVGHFVYPLVPLDEQWRITDRIDQLMRVCDELESRLRQANEVAGNLSSAVIGTLTGVMEREDDVPVKPPETELFAPLRVGLLPAVNAQAPLATLLARHHSEMSARDLWQRFGGEIDAFYAQLKAEVAEGWIQQPVVAEVREKNSSAAGA